MWSRIALAGLVSLSIACSSGADAATGFPQTPYAHVDCVGGGCSIDVRTSPQPPRVGVNTMELTIRGRDGEALDGITIDVTPTMVAHGHGASVHPTVTPRGGGIYVVDDVSTYMAGTWELHTKLQGTVTDEASIVLDVR